MLNIFMLVSGLDEDEEILKQLRKQDVLVEDWDLIIAIPIENNGVVEFFSHDDEGKLICTNYQLNRMIEDLCGDAVWYENIEVGSETCWVGLKYH